MDNLKSQCITWMIISLIMSIAFMCCAYKIGKLKSELYQLNDYSSKAVDITEGDQ